VHVAWGLDGTMKAEAGAAPVETHSFAFGLDRLLAGYVVGDDWETSHAGDDGAAALIDGILPVDGVCGSESTALGQLDRLLDRLRSLRKAMRGERTAAEWSQWFREMLDALFAADPDDEAETAALDVLHRLAANLGREPRLAGVEPRLAYTAVREALRQALDEVPEEQPFLLGGMTFCGLVPQRTIPFRVVCLIGLNDGEFPRATGDGGLNLMNAQPRRGDRDPRQEDRYLFLEALMAARDTLHLSYVGQGAQDGKRRNPATPLAELLQFLDEAHGIALETDPPDRPWRVCHALQPFDARYFVAPGADGHDPRWFSHHAAYGALGAGGTTALPPFVRRWASDPAEFPKPEDGPPVEVALRELIAFWRDPARHVLTRELRLHLAALDEGALSDIEPLDARVPRIERVEARLVELALRCGHATIPERPPAWLATSGLLAAGVLGELAYTAVRARALALLEAARRLPAFSGPACVEPVAIALPLADSLHLTGSLTRCYRAGDAGLWLFAMRASDRSASFRELLPFYIEWACLRLSLAGSQAADLDFLECHESRRRYVGRSAAIVGAIRRQPPARLQDGLGRLLRWYLAARHAPLPFFPQTAWSFVSTEDGAKKAASTWSGSEFGPAGECNYAPGYAALLARANPPLRMDGEAVEVDPTFAAMALDLARVLDPEGEVLKGVRALRSVAS